MVIERRSISRDVRKRIYIAFEGEKTEPKYFNELRRHHKFTNATVELVELERVLSKKGHSNPISVFKELDEYAVWVKSDGKRCSTKLFVERVLRGLSKQYSDVKSDIEKTSGKQYKKEIYAKLQKEGCISDDYIKNLHKAVDVAKKVLVELTGGKCLDCLTVDLLHPDPKYEEGDMFFMIVDRDQRSFTSEQVKKVISECEGKGYHLIISNPNFELWLLLHCMNDKARIQSRVLETKGMYDLLREYIKDYDKSLSDFGYFVDKVEIAKKNSRCYCTDINILKNELTEGNLDGIGTNMIDLFENIKKDNMDT